MNKLGRKFPDHRTRDPFYVVHTGQIPQDTEKSVGRWRVNLDGKMERYPAHG